MNVIILYIKIWPASGQVGSGQETLTGQHLDTQRYTTSNDEVVLSDYTKLEISQSKAKENYVIITNM